MHALPFVDRYRCKRHRVPVSELEHHFYRISGIGHSLIVPAASIFFQCIVEASYTIILKMNGTLPIESLNININVNRMGDISIM